MSGAVGHHPPRAAGADLAWAVAVVARGLRRSGVRVGVGDEVDAAACLVRVPAASRDELRSVLRVGLKVRRHDWERLDAVLDDLAPAREVPASALERAGRSPGSTRRLTEVTPDGDGGPGEAGTTPGYSPEALLRQKPFEECTPAEVARMEVLLRRLARRLAARRGRRRVPSRASRGEPDLRRSLRRALSTDGELVAPARRARALDRPRLLVVCDTSGSMEANARFLLTFVLALGRAARGSEVFAFNTTLVRLTPLLARGGVGPTLARLAAGVPDWAGGTRIGASLAALVRDHLRGRIDRRTVVVILSDGLDRGEPGELAEAMRALHERAREVIWLNPLLGDPRYEPTARGMSAALPHVDRFLPAHDLASLERLLPLLSR